MSKFPVIYLLLLTSMLTRTPVLAEVTVRFEPAGQYTDLALSGVSTPAIQSHLLNQFENHFRELGERYLPQVDKLEFVVQDIDMAGAMEPCAQPT